MKDRNINYFGIFCLVVMFAIAMSICGALLVANSLTNNIAFASDYNPNLLSGTLYSPSNFSTMNSTYDGHPYPFNKYSGANSTYIGSFSVDNPTSSFCTIVRTGTAYVNGLWGCDVTGVLEPNTTYTISINVKAINGSNTYMLFAYNSWNPIQINTYPQQSYFSNVGVNSYTFNTGSTIAYNYVGFTFGTQLGDITWDRFKLEIGDHFTGWEYTEYMRGYDNGYEDGYDSGYLDGTSQVSVNASLPLLMYHPNQVNAEFGDWFTNLDGFNYDGVSYYTEDNYSFDIGGVYRYEISADVSNSGYGLGIKYSRTFYGTRFNISFGVDLASGSLLYNSLRGVLFVGSDNKYFYDLASDNSIYEATVSASLRCTYYSLNVNSLVLDNYEIYFLFNSINTPNSDDAYACLVLPFSVSSDMGNTANSLDNVYSEAFQDGLNRGDQLGYLRGKTDGYENGYRNGVADSSNYSFLGLMSSVVEAPVNVVSQMLDFEVLGFNIKIFFYSMISVALFIFVIKLFI